MKHLHTLSIVFSGFKTATTCCGRRVKLVDLAVTQDADCPDCRQAADSQHRVVGDMLALVEERNDLDELRSPHIAELRVLLDQGPRYRNALL